MIRRSKRICFRLTPKEEADFHPLIGQLHAWTWSDLIRMALKQLSLRSAAATSDNGVRQKIEELTGHNCVNDWMASFPIRKNGKATKGSKK